MSHSDLTRVVVAAHHTPDLYGSDRQFLESVGAMTATGLHVVAVLPHDGPLVALLRARGADVRFLPFPVLRRVDSGPAGLLRLARTTIGSLPRAIRLLRQSEAEAVYVNTLVIPFWLLAARLARVPAVCHVHEAVDGDPRILRTALVVPLLLARVVVTNSSYTKTTLAEVSKRVVARAVVVHNGVTAEDARDPEKRAESVPGRLLLIGRLAHNKGIDIALEAVALLVGAGTPVHLEVVGSTFPGYESYERALRSRATRPDLAGHVTFAGYVHPVWDRLREAAVVVVPSRVESLGTAAVEAQLAGRPVVATAVQGLPEVVEHEVTGLLVPPEDPAALAAAVDLLLREPRRAQRLSVAARDRARVEFDTSRYQARITRIIDNVLKRPESH